MEYREHAPCAALRQFVRCYWTLEGELAGEPHAQRVFPDGFMEIIFHFGDAFHRVHEEGRAERQAPMLLAGQIWRPITLCAGRRASVLGIRFQAGGAYAFLRFPQQEVAGRIVSLEDFWGRRARQLRDALAEATNRVAFLEQQLLAMAPEPLAGLEFLSQRQYRRRFESAVGIPPKLHQRIRRFRRVLDMLGQAPMARVAADCGYYDQAHLIRDFKEFTGVTPSVWLSTQTNVLFFQDSVDAQGII